MYDFVDRSAERLAEGSRFILWAMRGWVQAVHRGYCPPGALESAFGKMGVLDALGPFHRVMLHLHRHGRRQMVFGALDQPTITEIEAVLLALWRTLAVDPPNQDRGLVTLLVRDIAVEPLLEAASEVAAWLSRADLAPTGLLQEVDVSALRPLRRS